MPKFSLRVLAAKVAGIAVSLGLLRIPYPHVAYAVGVFVLAAVALAAFMAIGSCQPRRSFWLGFVVGSLAVIWNTHSETPRSWGLPHVASDIASRADGHLGWSTPPATAALPAFIEGDRVVIQTFDEEGTLTGMLSKPAEEATAAELKLAIMLPSPAAFRSIFVHLSAVLFGLLGGWIAWAARRHAMRAGNAQPPAG